MKSFVSHYFDNKPLDKLKKTITPGWTDKNLKRHLDWVNVPADAYRILEIGCGIGRLLKEIAGVNSDLEVFGLDASKDMIKEGKKYCSGIDNLELYHTSSRTVESFAPMDFVFAWLVFQHIPNPNTVLAYVKSAGEILALQGQCKFQLLTNDEKPDADLWTWHDPECLADTLREAGCDAWVSPLTNRWTIVEGVKIE